MLGPSFLIACNLFNAINNRLSLIRCTGPLLSHFNCDNFVCRELSFKSQLVVLSSNDRRLLCLYPVTFESEISYMN